MVQLLEGGAYLLNGTEIVPEAEAAKVKALTGKDADKESARKGTIVQNRNFTVVFTNKDCL